MPFTWLSKCRQHCRLTICTTRCLVKVIDVLSKLSGLWIDTDKNVLYSQATLIKIMCPMRFA